MRNESSGFHLGILRAAHLWSMEEYYTSKKEKLESVIQWERVSIGRRSEWKRERYSWAGGGGGGGLILNNKLAN